MLVGCLGEPAARVAAALKAAEVESVVLFVEAEADGPWLDDADYACLLPADPGADPFADPVRLMSCAMDAAADSYHPGPRLLPLEHLQILDNLALGWAGPMPAQLILASELLKMRQAARDAGLEPVLSTPPLGSGAEARQQVERLGLPLVERRDDRFHRFLLTHDAARQAADGATGLHMAGVRLVLERAILPSRHLLVPVLGDGQGGAVHLPAIEQTARLMGHVVLAACPPAGLSDEALAFLGEQAAQLAAAIRWQGVASVEFFSGPDGRAWFHRLHPGLPESWWLSESVAGADLVGAQVALLRNPEEPPAWDQEDIGAGGHAIRMQIVATGPGTLEQMSLPDEALALRAEGAEILPGSALAAFAVHSATRHSALVRAVAALQHSRIAGVETNREALLAHLTDPGLWSKGAI